MKKKRILKTFIQGEAIRLSIDGISRESTFVRVSGNLLTLFDDDKEKEIELGRINQVTL